jgi:hypothetical protein
MTFLRFYISSDPTPKKIFNLPLKIMTITSRDKLVCINYHTKRLSGRVFDVLDLYMNNFSHLYFKYESVINYKTNFFLIFLLQAYIMSKNGLIFSSSKNKAAYRAVFKSKLFFIESIFFDGKNCKQMFFDLCPIPPGTWLELCVAF